MGSTRLLYFDLIRGFRAPYSEDSELDLLPFNPRCFDGGGARLGSGKSALNWSVSRADGVGLFWLEDELDDPGLGAYILSSSWDQSCAKFLGR